MQITSISDTLGKLAQATHRPELEVMTQALEKGLQQLWAEHILGNYLGGQISRQKAIEIVGIDWVELAERQQTAAQEDIQWALQK